MAPMRPRAFLPIAALVVLPAAARADVQHTVARGHTIEAIANRYHVTAKAIIEANKLKDVKRLQPGDVLTIPGVKAKADRSDKADKEKDKDKEKAGHGKGAEKTSAREDGTRWAMKPKTPGVLHVKRVAMNEDYDIRVDTRTSHVPAAALKTFEKMMRSPSGAAHPIEPRLIALLAIVSNHFGSRKIEVVSGFRPFTPTQHNPHSNHMHGKAIDFRIPGVPNEVVRDFCRTLRNTGCGYYPNSVFVHMDTRDKSTSWIDYSKPGETPRYDSPDVDADESASDAHVDATSNTPSAPPGDAPSDEPSSMPPLPPPDAPKSE